MPGITDALKVIIQSGLLGALFVLIIVPLAYFAYKMNSKYHDSQKLHTEEIQELTMSFSKEIQAVADKRTADAQAVLDRIMQLSNNWNNTINEQLRVADAQREWLREVRDALRDLGRGKNAR